MSLRCADLRIGICPNLNPCHPRLHVCQQQGAIWQPAASVPTVPVPASVERTRPHSTVYTAHSCGRAPHLHLHYCSLQVDCSEDAVSSVVSGDDNMTAAPWLPGPPSTSAARDGAGPGLTEPRVRDTEVGETPPPPHHHHHSLHTPQFVQCATDHTSYTVQTHHSTSIPFCSAELSTLCTKLYNLHTLNWIC